MGNGEVVDSMIHDGLWCAFEQLPHGQCPAKWSPSEYGVRARSRTRTRPRAIARRARGDRERLRSRTRSCRSRSRRRRATPIVVDRDEAMRADTTVEALAALKPAFKTDGTVTAGNAPGVNDGAAALVVMAAERARERSA